jgi:hypothetical protein
VVKLNINRVAIWFGAQEYTFIDMIVGPKWTGEPLDYAINATYDAKNYTLEEGSVLFSSYFFMSNEIIYHEFTAFNFVDLLSNIGGLFSVICSFFGIPAMWINERTIIAKYIRSLYYINKPEEMKKKLFQKKKEGGYSGINNYMVIRSRFYNYFWKKPNKE